MRRAVSLIAIVVILVALLVFAVIACNNSNKANLYATTGRVIKIDYRDDSVTFEDRNGNLFAFYDSIGFRVGDSVYAVMNSAGTLGFQDDMVINAINGGSASK